MFDRLTTSEVDDLISYDVHNIATDDLDILLSCKIMGI